MHELGLVEERIRVDREEQAQREVRSPRLWPPATGLLGEGAASFPVAPVTPRQARRGLPRHACRPDDSPCTSRAGTLVTWTARTQKARGSCGIGASGVDFAAGTGSGRRRMWRWSVACSPSRRSCTASSFRTRGARCALQPASRAGVPGASHAVSARPRAPIVYAAQRHIEVRPNSVEARMCTHLDRRNPPNIGKIQVRCAAAENKRFVPRGVGTLLTAARPVPPHLAVAARRVGVCGSGGEARVAPHRGQGPDAGVVQSRAIPSAPAAEERTD